MPRDVIPTSESWVDPTMATRKQKDRIAVLKTPLGEDVLVLNAFEGEEALSTLFEYRVTAESDQDKIDFKKAIGKNCAVKLNSYGTDRYFNGVLVEAEWNGTDAGNRVYTLVLRPWLWVLTQTSNCKIFAKKTIPDIIKAVFQDHGFQDYKLKTVEDYPVLEYCVQYCESDFAFVSRLMESAGLYYYFTHKEDAHTLEIVDAMSSHAKVEGNGSVVYHPGEDRQTLGKEHFHTFSSQRRLRTGKITVLDYDFMQPSADLKTDKSGGAGFTHGDLEMVRYPGKYPRTSVTAQKKRNDGTSTAKVLFNATQALDQRRYAEGDAASLFAGGIFSLKDHPDAADYAVVGAKYEITTSQYRSGGGETTDLFKGSYELLDKSLVFKAPEVTPRPIVHGPQTARVVCKNGEEIDVDDYGRVLVKFFWDRLDKENRRVRVAQMLAGSQWGCQFIPRVDQEVVVEFLEGDPDKPLIVGTVYNAKMKLPYDLPANKTMVGFKSNSSKGGNGYNEFVFDDKKSNELVRMQAQRDYQVTILNSETRTIGASFEKSAKGDPSRTTTLKKGDDVLKIEKGNHTTTLDLGDQSTTVTAGKQTIDVGQTISITAKLKIELTVGGSSITIDPTGVTIKAPMINFTADAMIQSQAVIIQESASAMLVLQGAMTMIN